MLCSVVGVPCCGLWLLFELIWIRILELIGLVFIMKLVRLILWMFVMLMIVVLCCVDSVGRLRLRMIVFGWDILMLWLIL